MNSRERVIKTLNHQEPDRVPLALGGSYYNLDDDVYFNLLKYLNLPNDQKPFRFTDKETKVFKSNRYLDERLHKALNIDFRYIYQENPSVLHKEGRHYVSDWGLTNIEKNGFAYTKPSLSDATIEDVKKYNWPNPKKYELSTNMVEKARDYQREGFAVVARSVCSYGFLETAGELRGREQFYIDMITDKKFAHYLIDKVGETLYELNKIYLEKAYKHIDILELPGDDYGAQNSSIISLEIFLEFFKAMV